MLFDCSKLDISDEFEEVVKSLDGNHDKVRCLLNKADQVDPQELFRVYGALLWSLGKVVFLETVRHFNRHNVEITPSFCNFDPKHLMHLMAVSSKNPHAFVGFSGAGT